MRAYQIWAEGYQATGEAGKAILLGIMLGSSFQDACDRLAIQSRNFRDSYNPKTLTYWGCRLYDNEKDAREAFG